MDSLSDTSTNSLFDGSTSAREETIVIDGSYQRPPIPGFIFHPNLLLPAELCLNVTEFCMSTYFNKAGTNQIMLFDRAGSATGLPAPLIRLLEHVSELLNPVLPEPTCQLLFDSANPPRARQAILNLYHPGEGISPHIDLLQRFGDGIVGVSLAGNCVMDMTKDDEKHSVFLPEGSIMALTEEARYEWKHGISQRFSDSIAFEDLDGDTVTKQVDRGTRLSVTFRWMLTGADVVGSDE